MPDWVYLNGSIIPHAKALVPIEDRGLLFGEAVYEVTRVYNGKPFHLDAHATRMARSLSAIGIVPDDVVSQLVDASHDLIQRGDAPDCNLYWQVTRGLASPRRFTFYPDNPPTVFAIAYPASPLRDTGVPQAAALLLPDERWLNAHIKTTMLLPNNLAANHAIQAGCDTALMHRDDMVTEGNSSNFHAVINGAIRTHPLNGRILGGITRDVVLQLARDANLAVDETPVTLHELHQADEWLLTGTNTEVTAITRVHHDGTDHVKPVGPITTRLRRAFVDAVRSHP